MKFSDLQQGDVLIDVDQEYPDDWLLVQRDGLLYVWLHLHTGQVHQNMTSTTADVDDDFEVIRVER